LVVEGMENTDAAAEARDLARRLQAMVRAVRAARQVGVPVSVPPDVQAACRAVLQLSDGGGSGPGTPVAAGPALAEVPLRKLLLQVISPGERFTVPEIAERLAAMGITAPANKISNALGSWVSSGRLVRERKGQYLCPPSGTPTGQRSREDRAVTPSRKETTSTHGEIEEKKAV
jgi:hypothetical protein